MNGLLERETPQNLRHGPLSVFQVTLQNLTVRLYLQRHHTLESENMEQLSWY